MTPEFIDEPARRVPVAEVSDVLITGGGPAGFGAAVSAGRTGASVTLLEQAGAIGGMATIGLMSHWTGATRGGLYEEVLERCKTPARSFEGGDPRQIIEPETAKKAMLDMLEEFGVRLHLYTLACEPVMDGMTVTGVITESKSGRRAFMGKVVVDASGDGDIASRAGVPFRKGRDNDGGMQPMTLMFKVGGVDESRALLPGGFEQTFPVPAGDLQSLARENLPPPAGHVLLYRSSVPGVISVNMTNCTGVDGTREEDLTRAERTCRGQLGPIRDFLRKFVPGFEACHIISTASLIGVRETRRFEGEYTLTESDILSARTFDDWAVTGAHFNFDVHNVTGSGLDDSGVQAKFPQQKGYSIPYRCLVPRKVDWLLLSGRNISGTHIAHSSYRVMPICLNLGQASGTAAALCAKNGVPPRELDVKLLQAELKKGNMHP